MSKSVGESSYTFESITNEAWDRLVATSRYASVFNRRDFIATLGHEIKIWGIRANGEILAAAALQVDHDGKVLGPAETFLYYQGILLAPAITDLPVASRTRHELAVVSALVEGLTREHEEFWLCLHPNMKDIRALQWLNYHQPDEGRFDIGIRYTALLELGELESREKLVASFARGRQGDYKKALARGVTIEPSRDVSLLDELHAMTFARQQTDRGMLDSLLKPMTQAALDGGFGELLVARTDDGAAASATLFLFDRCTTHYLFGASDPAYRNTGAGTLVLAESLWRAQERGVRWADVVGINSPQRGEYKTSFGAAPTCYFEAHWNAPSGD